VALGLTAFGFASSFSSSRQTPMGDKVRGRVQDEHGQPVIRTPVIAITDRGEMLDVASDDTGRFFVDCPIGKVATLLALQKGRLPAELDLRAAGPPSADGAYTLTIGGEAGHIAGHLVDASGQPLAGWNVAALDERPLWSLDYQVTLEEWIRGENGATSKVYAKTGADGSFRIEGLVKPAYDVLAWDPQSFANVTAAHVGRSNPDVRIALSGEALVRDYAVRVVTADGALVPEARCSVGLRTGPTHKEFLGTRRCTTLPDGSLQFPTFPLGSATFRVDGDRIRPFEVATSKLRASGPNVLVERFTSFRVHLTGLPPVRIFAFDAAGEPLGIRVAHSGSGGLAPSFDLVYQISEILEAGGKVARLSVRRIGPQREVGEEVCSIAVPTSVSGVFEAECQ
jgi:hypothetical protein